MLNSVLDEWKSICIVVSIDRSMLYSWYKKEKERTKKGEREKTFNEKR